MKANLKRFHELMQRGQGVPAAAPPPAQPMQQPAPPPARPAVGEVISPLPGEGSGISGVRMAQAAQQVRASILTARDLVREGTGQFLTNPPGIEQIVAEAHRIADLAVMSVQHTGEIAEVTTAQALYAAQWQKKKRPEASAPTPDTTTQQRSTHE